MSEARDIRLVQVPHLRAVHRVLRDLLGEQPDSTIVIVPTRHAAGELRRTLGAAGTGDRALLTRAEWYGMLRERLPPGSPSPLTAIERDVLAWRTSDDTMAAGSRPPFAVRPGLVGEMLALYDGIRRHRRTVDDFERVLVDALEPGSDSDRGAARLLDQTRFLVGVFRAYERALDQQGRADEHRIRDLIGASPAGAGMRRLVLTVADDAAEPGGLYPADFDLLVRVPGLARIDVLATAHVLDAGFRERLFDLLPGIEEEHAGQDDGPGPVLLVPGEHAGTPYHVCRDREEELLAIARHVARAPEAGEADVSRITTPPDETLVVYQHPLPYVYLARRVFEDAGVAFTAADALPLAAEPYVAALDLVLDAAMSAGGRETWLRLLESPFFSWRPHGRPLAREDVQVLRAWWRDRPDLAAGRLLGTIVAGSRPRSARLRRACAAADAAAHDLASFAADRTLGSHLTSLAALLRARSVGDRHDSDQRTARARAATLGLIDELADAHARQGDRPAAFRTVVPIVHRAIEQHTFAPVEGVGGIRICDARTARYADASTVWIVGVNEGEWPGAERRTIFYPSGLLRDLGFPPERDRQAFARAAFRDLLGLSKRETVVSVFQLEHDAVVRPSVLLEDLDASSVRLDTRPMTPATLEPSARPSDARDAWQAVRRTGPPFGDPRWHGQAGPPPDRVLSVTQVERYLECPFRFFASVVLGLDEDDDRAEVGLDPRRRGTLVHRVFQMFFTRWTSAGHGAVTAARLPDARALLEDVATSELASLPEADRVIEAARLLGSAGAPGLGERVFRIEALSPLSVVERLLEFDLRGTYVFEGDPPARVALKGIADRIDLLADGTLRLIDYKTGRAPDPHRAIQLAVYALCAEQKLDGHLGRRWRVGEAAYLALAEARPWVPVIRSPRDRGPLAGARQRFLEALHGIAAGSFPPSPADRRLCRVCAHAVVCRKDYVGDLA